MPNVHEKVKSVHGRVKIAGQIQESSLLPPVGARMQCWLVYNGC